jgi:hypothetical protein
MGLPPDQFEFRPVTSQAVRKATPAPADPSVGDGGALSANTVNDFTNSLGIRIGRRRVLRMPSAVASVTLPAAKSSTNAIACRIATRSCAFTRSNAVVIFTQTRASSRRALSARNVLEPTSFVAPLRKTLATS